MAFHLIHRGNHVGVLEQRFDVMDVIVAHADGTGAALFVELLHLFPHAEVTVVFTDRPVDQIEIDVIGAQALQRCGKGSLFVFGADFVVPELGGDPDLVARNAAVLNGAADRCFVAIDRCGVDVAIACVQRPAHRIVGFFAVFGTEYAQTQNRDFRTAVEFDFGLKIHKKRPPFYSIYSSIYSNKKTIRRDSCVLLAEGERKKRLFHDADNSG